MDTIPDTSTENVSIDALPPGRARREQRAKALAFRQADQQRLIEAEQRKRKQAARRRIPRHRQRDTHRDTRPRVPRQSHLDIPLDKVCKTCGVIKPLSQFGRLQQSRDKYDYRCRACVADFDRARKYNITVEGYHALFESQGGMCAICRSPHHRGKGWHLDHDHDTGMVRGILCNGCNVGLARLGDNPETLIAAAAYLRKHGK